MRGRGMGGGERLREGEGRERETEEEKESEVGREKEGEGRRKKEGERLREVGVANSDRTALLCPPVKPSLDLQFVVSSLAQIGSLLRREKAHMYHQFR